MRAFGAGGLLWTCGAMGWLVLSAAVLADETGDVDRVAAQRGRALFERAWTVNDPLASDNGLGPMRNANSCVACHRLGGVGGAGPALRNVQLLSLDHAREVAEQAQLGPDGMRESCVIHCFIDWSSLRDDLEASPFVQRLGKVHANFIRGKQAIRTVVLHRLGPEKDYAHWREAFWGVSPALQGQARVDALAAVDQLHRQTPVIKMDYPGGLKFALSERNTPALFGLGQIDRIPAQVIKAAAKAQKEAGQGISGRPTRSESMVDVGRFGWRAHTATLDEFVRSACASELGLSSAQHRELGSPMRAALVATDHRERRVDLSEQQCAELVEFVRSLPAPRRTLPQGELAQLVASGEALFHKVGCAACHLPKLGDVEGLYSDLLLHDLGEKLKDPAPAPDEFGQTSYGSVGIHSTIDPELLREWRTPPLWGVADSGPYLHDGRALTLEEAILLHGGEAESTTRQYAALSVVDRGKILAFLNTLTVGLASDAPTAVARSTQSPGLGPVSRSGFRPVSGQSRPRPLSLTPNGKITPGP